jgi:mono/diheme cytochrome c family protein
MLRSALLLAVPAALCAQGQTPRSLLDLKLFYQQNCVKCHGLDGSATSQDGKRLKGLDFTSPNEMKGLTDAGLAKKIRNGIFFGQVMPAFKKELSEAEIQLLVQEIVRKAVKGQPIAPKVDTTPVAPSPIQSEKP